MTDYNIQKSTAHSKHNLFVILMLVAATTLISLALPKQSKVAQYVYSVDKPWLYPTLTAPFDIPIEYSEAEQKRITDSVEANFVKIYRQDEEAANADVALLSKAVAEHSEVPAHVRQRLVADVTQAYANGIVDNASGDLIKNKRLKVVRILADNGVANIVKTDKMRSEKQVYQALDSVYGVEAHNLMNSVNIQDYINANVVPDNEENEKLMEDALSKALMPTNVLQTGQAIVYYGNVVDAHQDAAIKYMTKRLEEEQEKTKTDEHMLLLGKILLVAIMLMMYWYFLTSMRYRVYSSMRSMIFLIAFMTIFIVGVFMLVSIQTSLPILYLIPFAMVPIIIRSFFDVRIAFFTHIVVVLITSLVANEQAQFIIMQFLAGCIAIASIQELMRRSQLVTCAFLIFLCYSFTYVAIEWAQGADLMKIEWRMFTIFGANCIALSFAYFGIFLVEKLFGFTSIVTLVELSDINSPVLRKLSERCPGTFQHSLQVANIAEEAAIKVGASQQLARVGALYHDIGKTENPAFFTENQSGVNPHDALAPEQSAHIVVKHVTDGLLIAEKNSLPQVIKDLIAQHHGTSVTRFFYSQACKAAGDKEVDPTPYSYPGPRPQTKEAAILMMADACEAATRSLKDYSEKSIASLVEKIVESQISSGQLKEAPISFNQVELVKGVFVERLKTFYHHRISYPDDVKPIAPKEEETNAGE